MLTAPRAGGDDSSNEFDKFIDIVNEYIKDHSSSEINIDGTTKKKMLAFCERSAYASLDVVSDCLRSHVLA